MSQNQTEESNGYEFVNEFYPKNIKRTIHLITQQLKQETSLNIDYLFLPFRKEQTNEALLRFLNAIMPRGDGKALENESKLIKIIKKTQPGVLFQALKYIWSRTIIPSSKSSEKNKWNGVVGYDAYLKFRDLELEKMYPRKAFLELMPRCLKSPDHASLVYDMFDLISTISSNAPKNKMSCRKISKMCAIWAFDCSTNIEDPDSQKCRTLSTGIQDWAVKAEAMFHLSIAFIRSFAPEDENIDKSNFPVSLLHVLKDNKYPPEPSSTKSMLQIPVISLQRHYENLDQTSTNEKQKLKPWSLIENINELFKSDDFMILENESNMVDPINENKVLKLSRQQKALIKSIFSERSTIETISKKMSKQSKKIMKEFTTRHSSFQAGWNTNPIPSQKMKADAFKNTSDDYLTWNTCYIDDFYIWTWMSSLSNEENPRQRNIFGRSLILEFEFDAFKKWVVFEEVSVEKKQLAPKISPRSELRTVSGVGNNSNENVIQNQFVESTKQRKVSQDVLPSLKKVDSADYSSEHDVSNVSSNYNNKTFLNGYMTNGDITNMSAVSKPVSERYILPDVDESEFNIDLPDIDPSQITIDRPEDVSHKKKYVVNPSDSITDVIKGLDKELDNVQTQPSARHLDPFGQSHGSSIRSLQFGSSIQSQPHRSTQNDTNEYFQPVYSDPTTYVPERSPERSPERYNPSSNEDHKQYASEPRRQAHSNQSSVTPISVSEHAQQPVPQVKQTSPVQQNSRPKPVEQQMFNSTGHKIIVQPQSPVKQYSPEQPQVNKYDSQQYQMQQSPAREQSPVRQQSPVKQQSPVRQQYEQVPVQKSPVREQSPVRQQYEQVPVQKSPVRQQYEQAPVQKSPVREQSPVRQQYEQVPVQKSPVRQQFQQVEPQHVPVQQPQQMKMQQFQPSQKVPAQQVPVQQPQMHQFQPSQKSHVQQMPQQRAPVPQMPHIGHAANSHSAPNILVGHQGAHGHPQSQPTEQGHVKPQPKGMPMNGQRPGGQGNVALPRAYTMQNMNQAQHVKQPSLPVNQVRTAPFQRPNEGGMPRSDSFSNLPGPQKAMRGGMVPQQRLGTIQQPPQQRMGTMQQPPHQRMGTMQQPPHQRMGTMQQPPQQRMGTMQGQYRQGTMQGSYSSNNINGMVQNRAPAQPFMGQQIPRGNMQGMPGAGIMPTSNKHRKQDTKNLQQQLRNGAFGM